MDSLQIQQTRAFQKSFHSSLTRQCRLTIISPFITAVKPWSSVLDFARFFLQRHGSGLTLVTRPPGADLALLSPADADGLANMGVDLKIRNKPTLHSKIYFFEYEQGDYTAYIGSANFTKGGFSTNDETVAQLRTASDKSEILKEVNRLKSKGAFPYHHWRKQPRSVPNE